MESKRKYVQEGDEKGTGTGTVQVLVRESKRSREDKSQEPDTLGAISGYSFVLGLINDLVKLEDPVRRVVQDELEKQLSLRTTFNKVGTSGGRFLELVFENKLPDKIYTCSNIQSVKIALYDKRFKSIVSHGPLSSMKIEICVLNGDFDCEEWTSDAFNAKILRPRENKGQLLKGKKFITLENGVGYITNVQVTDNSKWIRCGSFMFGAKALQSNLNGAIDIKEGRSNPFIVRDIRGQSNLKDYAPSLNDEICCLKHIPKGKKTDERLRSSGIRTVKDLLQEHETDPSSLQKKFGNISKKHRREIIEHAMQAKNANTCIAGPTSDRQNYHSENRTINSYDRVNFSNIAQQEICGQVDPQNCAAREQQYCPGTSNINPSASLQIDDVSAWLYPSGDDGAEPSNSFHFSPTLNPKGKGNIA